VTVALDRALPTLTVRAVQSTAVTVPMRFALGTSAATVREAPLLLIDLLTEEGVTGRSYLFCYRPSGSAAIAAVLHEAGGLIAGDRLASVTIAAKLERCFALIGVTGVSGWRSPRLIWRRGMRSPLPRDFRLPLCWAPRHGRCRPIIHAGSG